eukprot:1805846-Pyramimonas_sp.AAC.4
MSAMPVSTITSPWLQSVMLSTTGSEPAVVGGIESTSITSDVPGWERTLMSSKVARPPTPNWETFPSICATIGGTVFPELVVNSANPSLVLALGVDTCHVVGWVAETFPYHATFPKGSFVFVPKGRTS